MRTYPATADVVVQIGKKRYRNKWRGKSFEGRRLELQMLRENSSYRRCMARCIITSQSNPMRIWGVQLMKYEPPKLTSIKVLWMQFNGHQVCG